MVVLRPFLDCEQKLFGAFAYKRVFSEQGGVGHRNVVKEAKIEPLGGIGEYRVRERLYCSVAYMRDPSDV